MSLSLANIAAYTYLMAGRLEDAARILGTEYPGEQQSATMVATRGLYRLRIGDIEGGRAGYKAAIETARRQGDHTTAQLATQKMHLELARTFWLRGWSSEASKEVRRGLAVKTPHRSYRAQLEALAGVLTRSAGSVGSQGDKEE
jgi:hypothetical protein